MTPMPSPVPCQPSSRACLPSCFPRTPARFHGSRLPSAAWKISQPAPHPRGWFPNLRRVSRRAARRSRMSVQFEATPSDRACNGSGVGSRKSRTASVCSPDISHSASARIYSLRLPFRYPGYGKTAQVDSAGENAFWQVLSQVDSCRGRIAAPELGGFALARILLVSLFRWEQSTFRSVKNAGYSTSYNSTNASPVPPSAPRTCTV